MGDLRVRVPASSANLGPGFDSFAIALPILAEFEMRPARTWSVSIEGDGDGIPTDDENLFIVAARAAAKAATETLGTYHVTQRSAIPAGRGLGSSAAAIVGGVVAANALLGGPLDRRSLLRVASEVEGHADNVAAALYGALLSIAMVDRLHQRARAQLVTGLDDIIAAARGAGAFGAALSGAGPAVIAVAPARLADRVVAAMEESAHAVGMMARGRVVRVRAAGAQVRRQ